MSSEEIIRAWKDPQYRRSLTKSKARLLPKHPAGIVEIADEDLGVIAGGFSTKTEPSCSPNPLCCPSSGTAVSCC